MSDGDVAPRGYNMPGGGSWERAIAAIARRQGGHVTRQQLLALGMSSREIGRRLERSYLIAVFNGVYSVGHLPTTRRDQAHGALLACGAGSFLAGGSAAAVWGVLKRWRLPFEVVARADRHPSGIIMHHATRVTKADVRVHWRLRVASPALMVIQIAPRVSDTRLKRVVNDLRGQELLTLAQLADTVERYQRRAGVGRVRALIAQDHGPTRSEFEDAFQLLVEQHGLPQPRFNTRVAGHLADAYFEQARLIVELDGWGWHRLERKFESDRAREAHLPASRDVATVRITWERFTTRPAEIAAQLHRIIARRIAR